MTHSFEFLLYMPISTCNQKTVVSLQCMIILVTQVLWFWSCSRTENIFKDKALLSKIEIINKDIDSSQLSISAIEYTYCKYIT